VYIKKRAAQVKLTHLLNKYFICLQ